MYEAPCIAAACIRAHPPPQIRALLACFEILQARYVERVQQMWFIRAPSLFYSIWRIVKPFVAEKTRAKIRILRDEEVAPTALAQFDADHLPKEYGGKGELVPLTPEPRPWELPGLARRRRY
jgi:hypothetical protein